MTAQVEFKETDEAYFARLNEAARRVMDFFGENETGNPDYVVGFEHGFMKAVHTLPTSCDVYLFIAEGTANQFYEDGYRDALAHLGCNWIDDPEGRD